jgi:hypothetical protein
MGDVLGGRRTTRRASDKTSNLHDGDRRAFPGRAGDGVGRDGRRANVTGILEVDVQDEGLVFNREACRVHSLE